MNLHRITGNRISGLIVTLSVRSVTGRMRWLNVTSMTRGCIANPAQAERLWTGCALVGLSQYLINGHFFLQCSHHDGTNLYEIKKVTEKGISYYENWGSSIFSSDQRTEQEILTRIMNRYSTLPHYVHIMYGCPKVEFENQIA